MDWSATTLWWVVSGVLVAAELASGTFFLLMLALGAAAGAIGGHLGLGATAQVLLAALVGGGATAAWTLRQRRARRQRAEGSADATLDVGQRVLVDAWDSDGTARVRYRGAAWSVRYAGSGAPAPGEHVIKAVRGSQLQVDRAAGH